MYVHLRGILAMGRGRGPSTSHKPAPVTSMVPDYVPERVPNKVPTWFSTEVSNARFPHKPARTLRPAVCVCFFCGLVAFLFYCLPGVFGVTYFLVAFSCAHNAHHGRDILSFVLLVFGCENLQPQPLHDN